MTRRLVPAVLAAVALLATALTGCQTTGSFDDPPDGVRVSVYQPRPDVAKNRIAIQVHNDGDEPVTITAASLHSTYFADDFIWGPDRTAVVKPGYAVDLRVDIPAEANCSDVTAEHSVSLFWTVGDSSGDSLFTPDDPFEMLELLHDAACLTVGVDAVAQLTAVALEVPEELPAPAQLLISVEPTGAEGIVTLDSIHSTTLLNPAGPDGIGVPELELGIAIDASSPPDLRIPIVPNRCDAHALAEDKVGTRMPLYVTAPDGTTGRLVLSADDELRAQMYAFYSAFCGL
jgi:hypothetical protein